MEKYYQRLYSKGAAGVTNDERENFKNSLVDYGHLQSPPIESSPRLFNPSNPSRPSPVLSHIATPDRPFTGLASPPNASTITQPSNAESGNLLSPVPPTIDASQHFPQDGPDSLWDSMDALGSPYNLDPAEIDALMADATQNFWVDFPGEASFVL